MRQHLIKSRSHLQAIKGLFQNCGDLEALKQLWCATVGKVYQEIDSCCKQYHKKIKDKNGLIIDPSIKRIDIIESEVHTIKFDARSDLPEPKSSARLFAKFRYSFSDESVEKLTVLLDMLQGQIKVLIELNDDLAENDWSDFTKFESFKLKLQIAKQLVELLAVCKFAVNEPSYAEEPDSERKFLLRDITPRKYG